MGRVLFQDGHLLEFLFSSLREPPAPLLGSENLFHLYSPGDFSPPPLFAQVSYSFFLFFCRFALRLGMSPLSHYYSPLTAFHPLDGANSRSLRAGRLFFTLCSLRSLRGAEYSLPFCSEFLLLASPCLHEFTNSPFFRSVTFFQPQARPSCAVRPITAAAPLPSSDGSFFL